MQKLFILFVSILILYSCITTEISKADYEEISKFLDKYEIVTDKTIESIIVFTKYITMGDKEKEAIENWKEKSLASKDEVDKQLKERRDMNILWKNKYESNSNNDLASRKIAIDNKMKNIKVNGLTVNYN